MANSGPGLGAFRRIVITSDKVSETKTNLEQLFNNPQFKQSYNDLRVEIKNSIKPNVLVIDLSGVGADSVSKKVRDIGVKFGGDVKIRNEKPLGNVKENKTINMNKKLIHKLIKEEIEAVQAEQGEVETGSEVSEAPKPRKLEKDEVGKFYVVTKPSKAKDNCVHELTMLEYANKIKSGELDESRIEGVYASNGHAKSHAKDLLAEIEEELDELKDTMEEYREFKNKGKNLKDKATSIITKYKK